MTTSQRIIRKKRYASSQLTEEEKILLADLMTRRVFAEHSFTQIAAEFGTTKTTLIKRWRDLLEKAKELKEE